MKPAQSHPLKYLWLRTCRDTHTLLHTHTLYFLFLAPFLTLKSPPQANWQNGAAQVEWFTCWTGGYGSESSHFSPAADTFSQKAIKRQGCIQLTCIWLHSDGFLRRFLFQYLNVCHKYMHITSWTLQRGDRTLRLQNTFNDRLFAFCWGRTS